MRFKEILWPKQSWDFKYKMPNFEHLKLYHARWSLCSEMVRVAMEEKGLSYESKEIKLIDQYPDGENISPEYLLINPKGVVPSLDIDGVIVTESTVIIKKLNSLKGSKDINLWPSDISKEDLENWVDDTTLTNGVPLGASFGATIPPFSSILLNHMVQKYVSVPQAFRILWKHPLRERGRIFFLMKFFKVHRSITKLNYENLIKGLLAIENQLKDRGPYFFGPFTHVDINLMCCFQRLIDVRLGEVLKIDELTNISKYWELLKSRGSYKAGILAFYGDKENQDIVEVFGKKESEHLEPLIELIKIRSN